MRDDCDACRLDAHAATRGGVLGSTAASVAGREAKRTARGDLWCCGVSSIDRLLGLVRPAAGEAHPVSGAHPVLGDHPGGGVGGRHLGRPCDLASGDGVDAEGVRLRPCCWDVEPGQDGCLWWCSWWSWCAWWWFP